jgi:hypothetical protein
VGKSFVRRGTLRMEKECTIRYPSYRSDKIDEHKKTGERRALQNSCVSSERLTVCCGEREVEFLRLINDGRLTRPNNAPSTLPQSPQGE